ncbi:MAG: hypothetical protein WCJ56_15015, partial [bacterium]
MKLTNVATALVAFALLITGIPASAYPSALNLIPTAAVLLANTAVFGYEIDGHQQPFDSTGRAQTLYSQVGIDGKLEAGVDLYSFTDGNTATLNAKYLLLEGTDELPAVAVGAFNVNKNGSPDYYL